jgi:methanogenic corrinoid protein MtbC1
VNRIGYGNISISLDPPSADYDDIIHLLAFADDIGIVSEVFFDRLNRSDEDDALALLHACLNARMSYTQIFDDVVRPTIIKEMKLFAEGKTAEPDLQSFIGRISDTLMNFRSLLHISRTEEKTALCAAMGNSLENAVCVSASELLETEGWKVYCMGTHITLEVLLDAIARFNVQLVCVSLDETKSDAEMQTNYALLNEAAKARNFHVLFSTVLHESTKYPRDLGDMPNTFSNFTKLLNLVRLNEISFPKGKTIRSAV